MREQERRYFKVIAFLHLRGTTWTVFLHLPVVFVTGDTSRSIRADVV